VKLDIPVSTACCRFILQRFNLNRLIENPESFEIFAVIRFLKAKRFTAAKIHQQLCGVYGPSIMS
jgi:hypothetical protein